MKEMLRGRLLRVMTVLLAVVALSSGSTRLWAQEVVNVEKAGTLSSVLSADATEAKISGSINGTDIKYLRQLVNEKKLTSIDLSEARIVKGGDAYYETKKTENDVVGESMFMDCKKLRTIVLPATVTSIGTNAFAKSGLREVDIPNSVNRLGNDAFAYCNYLAKVVIGKRVSKMDQGVFYSSAVKNAYVKSTTPASVPSYLFSSKPTIHVYAEALDDYKQSAWKDCGTLVGDLDKTYPKEKDSTDIVNEKLYNYFDDAACTELKAEYRAMSDEELTAAFTQGGMPGYMVTIALKLKNESWKAYEKDFRIHSYNAYSDATYWNELMHSTGGSYMGNPTGIYSADSEPIYVFVNDDVPADATLYIAPSVENDIISSAKTGRKLVKGLNVIDGQMNAFYYILYTADTKSRTKTLSEWPDMKIHIEGGVVNGYYDLARHSDKDYVALLKASSYGRFTVKGAQSLFHFKTTTFKKVWPSSIDKSICWFDSLTVWQKELMGFCESVVKGERDKAPYNLSGGEAIFPIYYNNPNFAIEGEQSDAGWANSTSYRTSYNSADCVSSAFNVKRNDHDDWCAAHECGHNNQQTINLEGGTEVSNNLFSNVVRFLDGTVTSTGSSLSTIMGYYVDHTPYFIRDVNTQLRMYYQLYLYYHQAQKNTAFFPTLFRELRADPMVLWKNTNNSSLKFVRKVCEVAQEDLTDFFTVWGFFEPCTNLKVEDYGSHTMSVRQADINRTLAEIAKYPKKNREILFVEDRAQYVLTSGFLTTPGKKRRESEQVGQCGELGQFTDYLPENQQPGSYTYLQVDSLYSMHGTGGIGFVVLDKDDKMIYASNALNFCIPTSLGQDFSIYSIDADGTLHETSKSGEGKQMVQMEKAGTLADSLSTYVMHATISGPINGTDLKYIRQLISDESLVSLDLTNARIISGGTAYYQSNKTATNIVGDNSFYQLKKLMSINLPLGITKIGGNAFASSGLREIVIPDGVASIGGDAFAYCDQLSRVVIGSKVKTIAQGAFYSSPVKEAFVFPTTPPSVSAYLFSSNPVIHVHAKSLAAYKASAWNQYGTIVGDLDDYEDITTVPDILPDCEPAAAADAPIYDLMGRRVTTLQPGTLYIQNGKKFRID